MLFNSLQFLAFFPIVTVLYFAAPQRGRWLLLLAASFYFYMCWKPVYAVLLVASTLLDYFAAERVYQARTQRARRGWLGLSLAGNFGLLFFFKYSDFFAGSVNSAARLLGVDYALPLLDFLLPVGISFYTFQTVSYTIDVYRGARPPERHIGKFAVYVAFFPQLVAGPIERSTSLLPQFDERHHFDWPRVRSGLILMAWGFFMKLVIADQAGLYVNEIYADPGQYSGAALLAAAYLFAYQIYGDFAGYSFIAIGAARVLGFRLMNNFDRPHFSKSIAEFWRRWHISLSTWFRDYLYIPLGGNRGSRARWRFVIFTVFVTSGLWHGANWTFLAWGTLHGLYVLIGDAKDRLLGARGPLAALRARRSWGVFQQVITFHLVAFALVIFRADDLAHAAEFLSAIPLRFAAGSEQLLDSFSPLDLAAIWAPIAFLVGIEALQGERGLVEFLDAQRPAVRLALYLAIAFGIACLGVFDAHEFIYFQF